MIRLRHKHPHGNVRRFGIVLLILFLETGAHTVGTVPAKAKTTLMHQPLDNLTNFSAPKEPSSYFNPECPVSSFRCTDGTCIPMGWRCDSKSDCSDRSDEEDCKAMQCENGQYKCRYTQKCIPNDWLCDGDFDCSVNDTSDEDLPKCFKATQCLPNQTECIGGICIDTEKFCDGKFDCINDEYADFCANRTILHECEMLNCSHACKPTPSGPKCYCDRGQKPNGTLCEDFDECSIDNICDQKCENTPGSYNCRCIDGYASVNKTLCKAINVPKSEPAALLFLTQSEFLTEIRSVSLDGSTAMDRSFKITLNTQILEVWHANRSVCLVSGTHEIGTLNLTCYSIDDFSIAWTFPKPEIFAGLKTIDELKLDWISKNWYFVNSNTGIIFVCNHKMTHCSILVESHPDDLSALELDPIKGYMFYTRQMVHTCLERANLDGSNQTVLAAHKITYPLDLTLDLANEHVYWIDRYMDTIERVDYNGKNRWSLKKSSSTAPLFKSLRSIVMFESQIYVASGASNQTVVEVNRRDPSASATILVANVSHPYDLTVFHRQRQPHRSHPCENGGGCDHICITMYHANKQPYAQCACSPGYRLATRSLCTKIEHASFLIYANRMIKGVSMSSAAQPQQRKGNHDFIVPIMEVKPPFSVDYNVKEQLIYFGQNEFEFIFRGVGGPQYIIEAQKLDGSGRHVVLKGHGHCHAIAYDWVGGNMFWASMFDIEVFSMANVSISKSLIHTWAASIVLDAKKGLIYWSTWGSQPYNGSIKSAWMDGSHQNVLVDAKERDMQYPTSLTIDFMERKLYWCDPRTSLIERVSLDGTDREIIISSRYGTDVFRPNSVAYHNQYIFWTDTARGNITRVHIAHTGEKAKFEEITHGKLKSTDLRIFDISSQSETDTCRIVCPALIIPTPEGCRCVCGDGYTFVPEESKCMPNAAVIAKMPKLNPCRADQFRCKTFDACIDLKFVCDGDEDCNDGSDESFADDGPCNAKMNCTNLGEAGFRCDGNRCIRNSSLCDGVATCSDGSDEDPEHCQRSQCTETEFRCKHSLQCIPATFVCDGDADCRDRSDEAANCGDECIEFTCKNYMCVTSDKLCDGNNDCGDGSDEMHCSSGCRHDEYYCPPKGCLNMSQMCDGVVDCYNGSDEEGCDKSTTNDKRTNSWSEPFMVVFKCAAGEFACHDGIECMSASVRCDGYNDCYDQSDEWNCTKIQPPPYGVYNASEECAHPNRMCKPTGQCVRVDQLCDGRSDCPDGSDEGYQCAARACDLNTECSHFCHNSPEGFVCSCPSHMFLKSDRTRCSYEHACEHWGTCSQVCEQNGKHYKCKCRDGYTLSYDEFTCRSNNPDPPYVIFSNREEIRGVDLKTFAVKNFFASLRNTIALDFLFSNGSLQIFWTDVIDDKIYRGSLIGGVLRNVEAVVQSGLLTVEGLAVDWIGHNLYWVDGDLYQIEVARLNGNFRRTLVAGEMSSPRAIAVDPREGLLFWTDWDKLNPRVERCSMAGEYRQTIVHVGQLFGAWPNGLTLDYVQKRVYWTDAHSDSIHTTNYDGGDHHLVLRDHETLSHPFSISVFENHVYWTEWRTSSVMRANKWNGSDVTIIDRTPSQPFDIQILHSSRQPRNGANPCAVTNGGCSHLCLLSLKSSYKCECPHVMRLTADNKTCVQNEEVLLFIMGSEIRGVDVLQPNHHTIPTISHTSRVLGPNVIDFLFKDNLLFWSDMILNEVKTSGLSSASIETILDTDLENLSGFAVDWVGRQIYVASEKYDVSRILACNLHGEYVTEILGGLFSVSSIVLDPARGRMYFAHNEEKSNSFRIESAALDGSVREIIVNCTELVDSLTIDFPDNRLYFVYKNAGRIFYFDLSSKTVREIAMSKESTDAAKDEEKFNILGLTVYNDDLYYSELRGFAIKKCNKNNCTSPVTLRNNTNTVQSLKMFHSSAQSGNNTCASELNKCSHLCFAISSTEHVCKCTIGYHLDPTNRNRCIGQEEFLFYSVSDELKGIIVTQPSVAVLKPRSDSYSGEDVDEEVIEADDDHVAVRHTWQHVLAPIPRVSMATNIDYHYRHDLLFWSDSDRGEITSIKRDGTNRRLVINQADQNDYSGSDWLSGIAVDWVADNIYWSDERRNIIEVARINGSSRYVVLSYVNKPKAIAVDPIAGFLFYAGDKKIGRTGLDGSQHFVLVNQSAQATSLVLDMNNQVVFWCEANTDTIWRVDYDGNSKRMMLNKSLDHPIALSLYDSHLFWADMSHMHGSIKSAPVTDLTQYQVIVTNEGSLSDLKIFSDQVQSGTNDCARNNGGCEELCLFNGTHPICACAHGEVSPIDGRSCLPYDEFLIYSRVTSIESIHVTNHLNMNGPIAKIQNSTFLRNTIGLSYNYPRRRIFYSDVHSSSINWVYFNGSDHQAIVNKQVSVEGVAYDPISDKLFWTSTSNSEASIRSFEMRKLRKNDIEANNEHVTQVIQLNAHDKPRGIAIESCLAMMYWTNWNLEAASIQRAYITGYGLESIITTDIRMPNAITLDYENHKLYWADARLDKIERVDYDGSHRVVLAHSTPKHPFAMAVYKNYLYWTDWVLRAVLRANKYSGADVVWLRKDIGRLMGIVAVQNTTQDCSANACSVLNGGCEDVCSLVDGKAKCECTVGRLANDGRRCVARPGDTVCAVEGEFLCKSGECIPFHLTCDSVNHCRDASDESLAYCNARICPSGYFQCNNRRCVQMSLTCDGIQHCGDGSDESICDCTSEHFKCASGQCIDHNYRCDQDQDCPDASDEIGCPIHECTGMPGLFIKCANTSTCYMDSWRCDGEIDCLDKSDEADCPNTTCTPQQFVCASGQCINTSWRCDGETDCSDGSDEVDCLTANGTLVSCKPNYFRCANGVLCIPQSWQCDGNPDCDDVSDEGPHCKNKECSSDTFKCPRTGRCIPISWICDGDEDCLDGGEDENDCDDEKREHVPCADTMFQCRNRQCIEFAYHCDGTPDCTDGTDEYEGCTPSPFIQPTCEKNQFQCTNGQCIAKAMMCDLLRDCEDGSDENANMCRNSTLICAAPQFYRCANGACVSEDKLCDGSNDCGDYSDEQTCNVNECTRSIEKALCAHNCEDRKVGYECTCNAGFKVSHKDRHLCEDIDECVDRPCSQNCTNSFGSYHCSCVDGYELKDKHICKAATSEKPKLIFSNRYYLREVDLVGHATMIAHNLSNAVALDYDFSTKCYYWSDVTLTISKIKRMCPSDNRTVEIHHTLLKNPDGLGVDWVAKNLYWCDKGLDTIEVSKLDGKYRKVLINKDLQEPRAIAIDPYERNIYWTDWGERPHIGKAGLDGSTPRIIIEDGFGWPNALTINFETRELYWGDAREDFIACSDLDGHNRKTILSRAQNPLINLHHIFAIAVWEDRIYWTDWETKSIESCHKDRGNNCSTILTTIHRPMDIRVFHSYRQRPAKENPCETANCETLCLLSPIEPFYRCECPDQFYLATDNKTCIANCTSAQFKCATTKKCIPFFWRCDSQDDCGDGSDEPASCRPFTCEPGEYQCTNRKCISPTHICDGKDQCGDGSDEIGCDNYVCFEKQFKCSASVNKTAFCIDASKRCNGFEECPNGDDEADCKLKPCPKNKFKCDDGKCIPNVWVCDGDKDCDADESDEVNCEGRECSKNEFSCKTGRCVPLAWKCDGESDCPDGEDEPESCNWQNRTCEDASYFKCGSGKCIPGRWNCDYHFDCVDKSDEANCTMRNCSESEFRCSDGRCIPGAQRCDGMYNCPNFSDEDGCNVTCIATTEFKCPNQNLCINNRYICDGDNDCSDGADEANCSCASNEFKCDDGRCIASRWRCDGWSDCFDGSDESVELCTTIPCGQHSFRCDNRRCIRKSSVCDGKFDCGVGDKSDERNCQLFGKCSAQQFQCERDQLCISKHFRCDGEINCVDASDEIDCMEPVCGFGACSQICLEKKAGSHNCRCIDGFVKGESKNSTCEALLEPVLLVASESNLRFLVPQKHMDASSVHGLLPWSETKIDAFDYMMLKESVVLYWIDLPARNIQKIVSKILATMAKREVRSILEEPEVIVTGTRKPKALAVDWMSEHLYILEAGTNLVVATDLNGGNRITICTSGPQPLDIAVDPLSRTVFWSTMERGIMAVSMDGTNKRTFIGSGIEWVTSLSIDYPTQRLYWADHRKGSIETTLLTGRSRHIVAQFTNRTSMPKRIQVFEDSVYVSLYDQKVMALNKYESTKGGNLLLDGTHRASDILILHPLKQQRSIANPCAEHPCDGQHVCLLSSTAAIGRTCKCADDFIEVRYKDTNSSMCNYVNVDKNPCRRDCNQGKCYFDAQNRPRCQCPIDFEGDFCESYRCSGYCLNRGICFVDVTNYTTPPPNLNDTDPILPPLKCKCAEGWTGDRCEILASQCRDLCLNGATCSVMLNGSEACICPRGFYGNNCQNCDELSCENQGVCVRDANGRPSCQCPDYYKGHRCENSVCEGFCSGHGQCTIRLGSPHCDCDVGFWDKQCQSDSCTDYCMNGGTCTINNANMMTCQCTAKYSGQRCEDCINFDCSTNDPCDEMQCKNDGTCHVINGKAVCNCTTQWNGRFCENYVREENNCVGYCENNGICRLDDFGRATCQCVGEWIGRRCNSPPICIDRCGNCRPANSINECMCSDGKISPCIYENNSDAAEIDGIGQEDDVESNVLTILSTLIVVFIILIFVFGTAIYVLRKRRNSQPFSHARLNDCVEMTNPMYLGELDDTPAFIHDDTKGRFTNPVYESMYAGASEPVLLNASNNSGSCNHGGIILVGNSSNSSSGNMNGALEEKAGLLQQDEPNITDFQSFSTLE